LGPDQLDAVKRVLKKAGVANPSTAQDLAKSVAATMAQHVATTSAPGYALPDRRVHDRLRALWRLAERPDPPIGLICAQLRQLPQRILREVEQQAERRWPIYFDERHRRDRLWVGYIVNVPVDKFLKVLPPSSSNEGRIILGRGRGSGRRSKLHFEATIGGLVQGSNPSQSAANPNAGGRPRNDEALELIAFLGMDWALATGKIPPSGRSGETPFGDLVHQVFGWLGLPDATRALRQYCASGCHGQTTGDWGRFD
jgi:hypothetical protein